MGSARGRAFSRTFRPLFDWHARAQFAAIIALASAYGLAYNRRVSTLPANDTPTTTLLDRLNDPLVIGTFCGLLAAVGYTATNVCLRQVAGENSALVCCLRALPTVLIFGPWLIVRYGRGEQIWAPLPVMGAIVIGAISSQLIGNVMFQYSLHIVGLAMAVPLCLGTLIGGSVIMGRVILREPITPRMVVSLVLLVAAITVLSFGAGKAHESVQGTVENVAPVHFDPWHVALGVATACLSGFFFACLGVSIRYSVTNRSKPTTTMFTVGLIGAVGLGLIAWTQLGAVGLQAVELDSLAVMLTAGVLNALSFLAMTKALQLTNIAYAYALNATQATMGALAGVLFFQEATTPWLGLGVALTIAGLLYMSRRK